MVFIIFRFIFPIFCLPTEHFVYIIKIFIMGVCSSNKSAAAKSVMRRVPTTHTRRSVKASRAPFVKKSNLGPDSASRGSLTSATTKQTLTSSLASESTIDSRESNDSMPGWIERSGGEMFLCWPYKADEDTSAPLKMCIGDEDFIVEAGSETVNMERGIRMALMVQMRSQQQLMPRSETVEDVVQ